ncbi:small integral membrane protein 12 isoform X1 [Erythrolamprus reginae]|uniref:small integral membrane protein 12 isoform X1 n=2 Tax=Erythrolamprus reginae TaxID=121349 RepID=UPI00396C32E2
MKRRQEAEPGRTRSPPEEAWPCLAAAPLEEEAEEAEVRRRGGESWPSEAPLRASLAQPSQPAEPAGIMWPIFWASIRTYAPYVTFPVAFVVGVVGYNLEWFIRGKPPPQTPEDEKSISERREDRKLQESAGKDLTQVISLKNKLEFAPKAVLNRNRPEKN